MQEMIHACNLLTDGETIARMTQVEFDDYWHHLGQVMRITSLARFGEEAVAEAARHEVSNTAAGTERSWSSVRRAPASASAGFGFGGQGDAAS